MVLCFVFLHSVRIRMYQVIRFDFLLKRPNRSHQFVWCVHSHTCLSSTEIQYHHLIFKLQALSAIFALMPTNNERNQTKLKMSMYHCWLCSAISSIQFWVLTPAYFYDFNVCTGLFIYIYQYSLNNCLTLIAYEERS